MDTTYWRLCTTGLEIWTCTSAHIATIPFVREQQPEETKFWWQGFVYQGKLHANSTDFCWNISKSGPLKSQSIECFLGLTNNRINLQTTIPVNNINSPRTVTEDNQTQHLSQQFPSHIQHSNDVYHTCPSIPGPKVGYTQNIWVAPVRFYIVRWYIRGQWFCWLLFVQVEEPALHPFHFPWSSFCHHLDWSVSAAQHAPD